MFDFTTTHAPPVRIKIEGTPYDVPRFLTAQFKAWVAARQKASVDAAMEQLGEDADARARFMLYFQPAPIDLVQLIEEATTPEGIEYVIGDRLKAAGVDAKVVAALLAVGDPATLRNLARELLSGGNAAAALRKASSDPGVKGNPTTGQPPTSGGSPTTTAETLRAISEATPDLAPTA